PLREVLGLSAGTAVTPTTRLDGPPACSMPGDGTGHPLLKTIEARLALGDVSLERLEREVRPRVSLLVGVDAAPNSDKYGQLGLGIELPFAQRNQGARALAVAQTATDKMRLGLASQRILRELDAHRAACEARRREADLLGTVAIPQARRALQLVESGWRAGKFDMFRVNAVARDVVR